MLLLVLIFSGPLLYYLFWPSDENRIRKLFSEGARAIESGKVDEIMSKVSYNYSDEHGLSYLYLKEGATRLLRQAGAVRVDYKIISIVIKDDHAVVDLEVRLKPAGESQEGGYLAGSVPANVRFDLEKERTKWLVVKTKGLPVRF